MFLRNRSKDFSLYPDTNEVGVGNQKVKLTPKEMGVLELLLYHSETTVSRTEFLEKVWGDKFANDQGLTQVISRLRGILSQNRNVTIKTIPKKGYHLRRREFEKKRPSKMDEITFKSADADISCNYNLPFDFREGH